DHRLSSRDVVSRAPFCLHSGTWEQLMPANVDWRGPSLFSFRDSWSQGRMGVALIVMANPITQNGTQMLFSKWNHAVQTLPPHRSDQSFTVGIGLWSPDWCAQNIQAQISNRVVDALGEDLVTVMD